MESRGGIAEAQAAHSRDATAVPLLYDAVALSMWAGTRAAFDVQTLGADPLPLEPGTLIVVTHRRETDIPLICPAIYFRAEIWRRGPRVAFAARDDMHEPRFLASFPARLPLPLRRALADVRLRWILERLLVFPVSRGTGLRIGEALEAFPEARLDELLPPEAVAVLAARAAELGAAPPETGRGVLGLEFAHELWQELPRERLTAPPLEPVWERRNAVAATEFRRVIEVLRRGAVLLVFPEGRPSPDGAVGPVLPGVDALIRLGRPRWLQPIGIAYDPLTAGRTRALVTFPDRRPAARDVDVLALLRAAVPLTVGQVAARARVRDPSCDELHVEQALAGEVTAAAREGRHVDPALLDPAGRRRRAAEALRAAGRRSRAELEYLAREHASLRGETL